MKRVLFVCSRNRLRSPTAEQIFSEHPHMECASAGTNNDADNPLTPELEEWADVIFVMEKAHRNKLSSKFKRNLGGKRVICLDIPDDYGFMDPDLIRLLKARSAGTFHMWAVRSNLAVDTDAHRRPLPAVAPVAHLYVGRRRISDDGR
ncbi:MAG: phosphotyrosine protein phosphatase [Verrucomicrobia bacterium]|nr:MAG: phosphotyrosine protein phosphatase [Verrucomicrobiota bacterium]